MKNRRLFVLTIVVITIALAAAFALASCVINNVDIGGGESDKDKVENNSPDAGNESDGKLSVAVTVENEPIAVKTDRTYLGELLKDLKKEGKIEFEYSVSQYGMFITSINGRKLAANEFVGIYLSSDDIANADLLIPTVTRGGTTYYSANKGADTLPLVDGVSYLLTVVVF